MKRFSIVSSMTKTTRGIGFGNKLPWKTTSEGKEDLAFFSYLTSEVKPNPNVMNTVIMGRKTWESLPKSRKPLPQRYNIIVTRNTNYDISTFQNTQIAMSLDDALMKSSNGNVYVIGGEEIFKTALKHPYCEDVYLSVIDDGVSPYKCDTFFPELPNNFELKESTPGELNPNTLTFNKYSDTEPPSFATSIDSSKFNTDETNYLGLLNDILTNGAKKKDRTNIGTVSVFGRQLRFSLQNGFPLMTTKKMFTKGIVEELLFFLRGEHDNRKLQSKGVHIWDGNTTREYLDKYNKQHIETNDLGVAYGVQWRAAGLTKQNIDTDYKTVPGGVDQLSEIIDLLKNDPHSRRIILNAWNVPQLKDMALVPCHMMYQFYVTNDTDLSCMMTQRSADSFLGLPFNIASTGLLTCILAKVTGLVPKEIIINIGDAHIYENHIVQVEQQLKRTPYPFPTLKINKDLTSIQDIEALTFEDFQFENYKYHPALKAVMAV